MSQRRFMVPAQFAPSVDALLDKMVLLQGDNPAVPEWGTKPCRPGEMIEVTIRRVIVPTPGPTPMQHAGA